MTGNRHAALAAKYAEQMKNEAEPWRHWSYTVNGDWVRCVTTPSWRSDFDYRDDNDIPKTIRIGEYDVPEPLREAPAVGTEVWVSDFYGNRLCFTWAGLMHERKWIKWGLLQRTEEAAELHARALIEISGGTL